HRELREPVRQKAVADPPQPSVTRALSGQRDVDFNVAVADYTQTGFDAADVLVSEKDSKKKDPKQKGWAIGGQTGQSHSLTLVAKKPIDVLAGSTLTVTIEHQSPLANHTLGSFRLSVTDDSRAAEWANTPAKVMEALRVSDE